MEHWEVGERVCAVELFIRTGSITETQRGFRREWNQQEAPSLWGYLKSKVYSNRPTDLHTLKGNISEEIAKLSEETLKAVMCSFLTRVH